MSTATIPDGAIARRPGRQPASTLAVSRAEAQSRRLMQGGVLLFLLGLLNGFFIHGLALPRVAMAAHLVALMGGTFLVGIGLAWPRLRLGQRAARAGVLLALTSVYGAWLVYLLSGALGAGGMFPLAAGSARAAESTEQLIAAAFAVIALGLMAVCLLLLWGLRSPNFASANCSS